MHCEGWMKTEETPNGSIKGPSTINMQAETDRSRKLILLIEVISVHILL